jgi:Putative stress-induced transcription regulator
MGRYDRRVTTPAPSLIRSLADTSRSGADPLASRDEAVAWLRAAGLLPGDADTILTGSEHGALLRLRDSLRDVLAARADRRHDADAGARLTRALADGRLVVTIDQDGASGLASSARATYSNLVAAIAIAAAETLRK